MGKLTISMTIFNSYVKLPEGTGNMFQTSFLVFTVLSCQESAIPLVKVRQNFLPYSLIWDDWVFGSIAWYEMLTNQGPEEDRCNVASCSSFDKSRLWDRLNLIVQKILGFGVACRDGRGKLFTLNIWWRFTQMTSLPRGPKGRSQKPLSLLEWPGSYSVIENPTERIQPFS